MCIRLAPRSHPRPSLHARVLVTVARLASPRLAAEFRPLSNMHAALFAALVVASSVHGKVFDPEPIGILAAAVVEGVSGYGRYPCTRVAADGSFSPGTSSHPRALSPGCLCFPSNLWRRKACP